MDDGWGLRRVVVLLEVDGTFSERRPMAYQRPCHMGLKQVCCGGDGCSVSSCWPDVVCACQPPLCCALADSSGRRWMVRRGPDDDGKQSGIPGRGQAETGMVAGTTAPSTRPMPCLPQVSTSGGVFGMTRLWPANCGCGRGKVSGGLLLCLWPSMPVPSRLELFTWTTTASQKV